MSLVQRQSLVLVAVAATDFTRSNFQTSLSFLGSIFFLIIRFNLAMRFEARPPASTVQNEVLDSCVRVSRSSFNTWCSRVVFQEPRRATITSAYGIKFDCTIPLSSSWARLLSSFRSFSALSPASGKLD